MLRLAGGVLLQAGAHHFVKALCKLGEHSPDTAASDRQGLVSQKEPERGQDMAVDGLRFPGINSGHKHCQVRETNRLTAVM